MKDSARLTELQILQNNKIIVEKQILQMEILDEEN